MFTLEMFRLPLVTLAVLLLSLPASDGGKVLVIPVDGSHWVNMKVLIEELHSRGHNITVIRPKNSWYIAADSEYYQSLNFNFGAGFSEDGFKNFSTTLMGFRRTSASPLIAFYKAVQEFMVLIHNSHNEVITNAQMIFEDHQLVKALQEAEYDVALTDPCFGGGVLLANRLGLPLVLNVRWTIFEDGHFTVAPSPFSYVPTPGSELTDRMTFWQRVQNVLYGLLVQNNKAIVMRSYYTPFTHQYFGPDVSYSDLVTAADIWLMRTDFSFEFPRPSMPNVVYMGGFQCKPAKPLPLELEDFVQGSGEHGVIIMSLGTLVGELPGELAEHVAAAFAQLPQRVIWRHAGKRPSALGNNTLLLNWLPQNDLLGHPKTKLFVAHGGTNGVQEAIYHGVPIVGLPLMFDQDDNLFRMRVKGVARVLDVGTLNTDNFLEALKDVLYNSSYKETMEKLSRLHRDQPMKPLDRAMFWIEFVMRHKGAPHLKTHSYKMSWIQYHSIDVITLLLVSVMMVLLISMLTLRFLCCKIFGKRKEKTN